MGLAVVAGVVPLQCRRPGVRRTPATADSAPATTAALCSRLTQQTPRGRLAEPTGLAAPRHPTRSRTLLETERRPALPDVPPPGWAPSRLHPGRQGPTRVQTPASSFQSNSPSSITSASRTRSMVTIRGTSKSNCGGSPKSTYYPIKSPSKYPRARSPTGQRSRTADSQLAGGIGTAHVHQRRCKAPVPAELSEATIFPPTPTAASAYVWADLSMRSVWWGRTSAIPR